MNWITKIIKAGEKIKTAIHKRASKDEIENSKAQVQSLIKHGPFNADLILSPALIIFVIQFI